MVVVVVPVECSPQPAVPAAVCKQMSESVPTPLSPLPTAPRALEKYTTQQPDLSLSPQRYTTSSLLCSAPTSRYCLFTREDTKQRGLMIIIWFVTTKHNNKKYRKKKNLNVTHFKIRLKWGLGKC